jgi:nicotinate-nucleotide adenylyltransferase
LIKENLNKIGILGGSFDPPHVGHVHISKIALKKLKLNEVIWIVTKQNPFKKKVFLNKNLRIKLSKNILKNEKKIIVKSFSDKINSRNTFDLLKNLKKKNKNSKLYFLMGADNMINLHKWKKWKKIPTMAKIIVFARTKYSTLALKSVASRQLGKKDWLYIAGNKVNISSTLIKNF